MPPDDVEEDTEGGGSDTQAMRKAASEAHLHRTKELMLFTLEAITWQKDHRDKVAPAGSSVPALGFTLGMTNLGGTRPVVAERTRRLNERSVVQI